AELLGSSVDVEGNILTASNLGISSGSGTLVNNGNGTWNYTPAANDDSSVSFSYTISDNGTTNGAPDPRTVVGSATLDITPVNDAPVAHGSSQTTGENTPLNSTVLAATDVDGTIAHYTLVDDVAEGSLTFNNLDGSYTFNPGTDFDNLAAGASRDVTFTYTATDDLGATSSIQTVTIAVTGTNDAPTTSAVTLAAIAEDSGIRVITQADLLANAHDIDGDSLAANNLIAGSGTLVNNGDGTWNYTPAANDDTSVSFTYDISDGTTTINTTATLDITPVNDAPTTGAVTLAAIAEDSGVRLITQAELLGSSVDVEGNILTASNLGISSGSGTLVNNGNGTWNYTPAANDDSSVSFSYTISDNRTTNGAPDPRTVVGSAILDITPVNDAPVAHGSSQTTGENTPLNSTVLAATDVDGTIAHYTLVDDVAEGSLTFNNLDGSYTFNPGTDFDNLAAGASRDVTFTYTATDDLGATSSIQTVTIAVTGTNDAPTTSAVTLAAIAEDSGIRVITQADLLANAHDIDGDSLAANNL